MNRLEIQKNVRPLTDVRKHLAAMVAQIQRTNQPLVLTQRGRAVAVMVSPAEYDQMAYREELVKAVHLGLAEADAGHLIPHDEAMAELRRRQSEREGAPVRKGSKSTKKKSKRKATAS